MANVQQPRNRPERYDRTTPLELPLTVPVLVRLLEPAGHLPEGFNLELPKLEAISLVRRRKAIMVGALDTAPDLVISEEDYALATP